MCLDIFFLKSFSVFSFHQNDLFRNHSQNCVFMRHQQPSKDQINLKEDNL